MQPGSQMNPVRIGTGTLLVPMTGGHAIIDATHPDYATWMEHVTWHELSDEERAQQLLAPTLPLLLRLELRARRVGLGWLDHLAGRNVEMVRQPRLRNAAVACDVARAADRRGRAVSGVGRAMG